MINASFVINATTNHSISTILYMSGLGATSEKFVMEKPKTLQPAGDQLCPNILPIQTDEHVLN